MTAGDGRLMSIGEDGASVTIPPGLVTATGLALDQLLARTAAKGGTVDRRLVELHRALVAADRANRAGLRTRKPRPTGGPSSIGTAAAAQLLGVTPARVRQLASEGRLAGAERHGRDWAIPPAAVDDYRAGRPAR